MKSSQLAMRSLVPGILALCMFSSLLAPPSTLAAESRTWTSEKGNTIKATYVRKEGLLVVLQTPDGRYVKILHSALSSQDQKYLAVEHSTINAVLPNGEKYVASGKSSVSVITYNQKRHRQIQEHYRQQNKARQKRLGQSSSSGVYGGRSYKETKRLQQLVHLKKWGKSQESDPSPVIWKGPAKPLSDEEMRRQAEMDRQMQKQNFSHRARQLRTDIESSPGAWGLANKASSLASDLDSAGESGAASFFRRAASDLNNQSYEEAVHEAREGSMSID